MERSHRTDNEEFWSRSTFGSFAEAAGALRSWEARHNTERSLWRFRAGPPPRSWQPFWASRPEAEASSMPSDRERLKGEGRSASRTRVEGGGRYLGTPRNERSSPSPSEINLQSNRSLFRGPLLDYREHLPEAHRFVRRQDDGQRRRVPHDVLGREGPSGRREARAKGVR